MKKLIPLIFFILTAATILALTVKGSLGNPTAEEIRTDLSGETQPFELSPERGRYALVMSIAENKSLYFTEDIARYVLPDLGYINGRFVSLFAPGVSFFAIPFYILGKEFNLAQVATFSLSATFALGSSVLIAFLVKKVVKSWYPGITAGLVFLFATPAWVYATTFYQHHATSFLILISLLIVTSSRRPWVPYVFGLIFGLSILVEYQNAVFFIPLALYLAARHLSLLEKSEELVIKVNTYLLLAVIGALISLGVTLWYNRVAYGNAFRLAGTVQTVRELEVDPTTKTVVDPQVEVLNPSPTRFFKLENLPNSMSVLLTSKERGILWYSPVILLGLLGARPFYKRRKGLALTIGAVAGTILILYGMWGDPWGGWAFGPRYLIPAMALMAIFLGVAINQFKTNPWLKLVFILFVIWSVSVNLAGALTTIQIPPSTEVEASRYPTFVFLHNYQLLLEGKSSAFFYRTFIKDFIELKVYALVLFFIAVSSILGMYTYSQKEVKSE